MSEVKPLLFVRRASGLTRAVSTWTVLFFGIGVSFMPWHYFLMTAIPSWFPGTNLPLIYLIGGLIVLVECSVMALLYVATPRSGAIYIPISRATSPMLGTMEAWRSIITNPTQRGVTAFLSAGAFFSLAVIVGQITKNPALMAAGSAMAGNVWLLVGIGLLLQIIGLVIDLLGPRTTARWVGFWGAGAVFGILFVNVLYAATPPAALSASWDTTFGAGAYDEIVSLATANGFKAVPMSWGAVAASLLLPVANTWPYCIMPMTGEVERPRRNIPFSMIGSAVLVMIINAVSAYNFTSTYGDFGPMYAFCTGNPEISGKFVHNAVMAVDLSSYAAVLTPNPTAAAIAAWSPQWSGFADMVVNATFTSRPIYAMGMDRMAPRIFSAVHPRLHSPYFGSLFWFFWSLITLFLAGVAGAAVVSAVVMGITFVYSFCRMWNHWAEIELPFSRPDIWKTGFGLTIAGFPVMTLLGGFSAATHLFLLASLPSNPVSAALMIGAIYGFGAYWYGFYAKKTAEAGIPVSEIYGKLPPE